MLKKTLYSWSCLLVMGCSLWASSAAESEASSATTLKLTPIHGSTIFSYDTSSGNPGYLHVRLNGTTAKAEAWSARGVNVSDIPFLQDLFNNESVMTNFGDGPRPRELTEKRIREQWITRFAAGQPHGALTVFDAKGDRIGNVVVGGGDRAGTSEVAGLGVEKLWTEGYGKSVFKSVIEVLVPEIWRIGNNHGLEKEDASIVKAFQCFAGKPLDQLDATSSPANVPSWKILLKHGFVAAECGLDKDAKKIDLSTGDFKATSDNPIEDYKQMEAYILETYFSDKSAERLVDGKRYVLTDHHKRTWTLSKHIKYNRLKFHFERKVVFDYSSEAGN